MRRDLLMSAAVAALTVVYLISALQLPASARQTHALGPRAYPMLIAVLLLAGTAALAAQAMLRQRRAGRDTAASPEGSGAAASPAPVPLDWRRLGAFLGATLVYLWVLGWVGFLVATTAYLLAGVLITGGARVTSHRQLVGPVVFSVLAAGAAWMLFAVVLNLRLPVGVLFGGTV